MASEDINVLKKKGRKKGSTKTKEEKAEARERREVAAAEKFAADLKAQYKAGPTSALKPGYKPGTISDVTGLTPPN